MGLLTLIGHTGSYEELELNKLSAESVKKRRDELLKMRALMSYHEKKCKRIKKIKSKKFHKVLRKSAEKAESKHMAELDELDPAGAAQRALLQEQKRAEERLTLKHKNNSKWVKRVLQRKDGGETETRQEISRQLALGDDLRRKQLSMDDASDSDSAVERDGEGEDEGSDTEHRAVSRLKEDVMKKVVVEKGVLGMGFMQRALERKRNEARAMLEELEGAPAGDAGASQSAARGAKRSFDGRAIGSGGRAKVSAQAEAEAEVDATCVFDGASFTIDQAAMGTSKRTQVRGFASVVMPAELTHTDLQQVPAGRALQTKPLRGTAKAHNSAESAQLVRAGLAALRARIDEHAAAQ